MLIRTQSPKTHSPEFKPIPKPAVSRLGSGVPVYSYNSGDQDVFRLELIFRMGSSGIINPSEASMTCNLLREGTKSRTAEDINNQLDYHGAFLDIKSGLDYSTMTLLGRSEFLPELIPLISEILLEPAFNSDALAKHKQKTIQNLEISQKKTSYWSVRMLRQSVFGTSHPYSRIPSIEKIDGITTSALTNYHKLLVNSFDAVLISGSFDQEVFDDLMDRHFGSIKPVLEIDSKEEPVFSNNSLERKMENTSQASIAIGGKATSVNDPDYPVHSFIIKILGGYFGSRLMKTLREEKGLTYGVHAYFLQLHHGDFLQIASDVKLEAVDESITVVKNEVAKLLDTRVEEDEINTVKNYMLGEYVNDSNTAFDFADLYKKIVLQELPEDYFDQYYGRVASIDVDQVESIKPSVINPDQLSTVKVY